MQNPLVKAVFNSDMLNDENHIYLDYNYVTYGFGLTKWPIKDDLMDSVYSAWKELHKYGHIPSVLFVPFKSYNKEVGIQTIDDTLSGYTFENKVETLGLRLLIMTPDYLKDNMRI